VLRVNTLAAGLSFSFSEKTGRRPTFEPHVSVFVLLGGVSPAKVAENPGTLQLLGSELGRRDGEAATFVKLTAPQAAVAALEGRLRQFCADFAESSGFGADREDLAAERLTLFGALLVSVVELLRGATASYRGNSCGADGPGAVEFVVLTPAAEGKIALKSSLGKYTFVATAELVKQLADLFSGAVAVDNVTDYKLCALLRFVLGYV
jgi:hypothetical protein